MAVFDFAAGIRWGGCTCVELVRLGGAADWVVGILGGGVDVERFASVFFSNLGSSFFFAELDPDGRDDDDALEDEGEEDVVTIFPL